MLQHSSGEEATRPADSCRHTSFARRPGIGAGFDVYDSDFRPTSPELSIGQVQRDGAKRSSDADALDDPADSRMFFLFLHLYEPHVPVSPAGAVCVVRALRWRDRVRRRARRTIHHALKDAADLYEASTIVLVVGSRRGPRRPRRAGARPVHLRRVDPHAVYRQAVEGRRSPTSVGQAGGRRIPTPVQPTDVAADAAG